MPTKKFPAAISDMLGGYKILHYCGYAIILGTFTELSYQYYRLWKARISKRNGNIEQVLWVNELTQQCVKLHKTNVKCTSRYCHVNTLNRVTELIDNARYTIDLCIYVFTIFQLADALKNATTRGVQVRIICDKSMLYSSGGQIMKLYKEGIPIRCPDIMDQLMHHKFCIFDGPAAGKCKNTGGKNFAPILLNGSLNWTFNAFSSNYENTIITANKMLISQYEEEFERLWTSFENSNFNV